ncbi:MAG: HAD family hydrolase [Chitinophagales bacterium]
MRTLLFDLDGTLLNVDMELFLPAYLKAVAARMAGVVPPKEFVAALMASTDEMVRNDDPERSNERVFWDGFSARTGLAAEKWIPVFEEFYQTDFHRLRSLTAPFPGARPALEAAFAQGYEVVIATNPVFPRVAIDARLEWAGLQGLPVRLVTSYEIMHFCKPNPRYFTEILAMIGRSPEEAIMIGNDAAEDMAAGEVGLRTFLSTEFLVNKDHAGPKPTWQGSLEDLTRRIEAREW